MPISIPMKAFEMSAQDGSAVSPSVGDDVTLDGTFKGVVKSEDGKNLTIDLTEYNGAPVTYVDDPAEENAEGAAPDKNMAKNKDLMAMMDKENMMGN